MAQFKPNIDYYALDQNWLNHRMLFIAGPRQVGKTSYVKQKIKELGGSYFNWDEKKVLNAYQEYAEDFFTQDSTKNSLIVFDEIHKRHKWKDILKGVFDAHRESYQFIITGSARLDTFRRSGDSLVGRYFLTHILPISVGDLINLNFCAFTDARSLLERAANTEPQINEAELEQLITLSGFPEPFYSGQQSFYDRWSEQHEELLVREDLRDLTQVQNLDGVEKLITLLKPRLASPVSLNSLAEDIEVKQDSIKKWLLQLEKIMLIFKVQPWSKKIQRSIKKSPKVYFYDWASIKDPGKRFENFIAMQLYKACILLKDRYGLKFELNYIRTYDEQEVDFLISLDSKPWLLIETKLGKPESSNALTKFSKIFKIPALILSAQDGFNYKKENIWFMSANRFLSQLP